MKDNKLLYDTFNARYLSFKEVADTFITNEHFRNLYKNNHTLLMGPRGCGKTTLLKMLTLPAITEYDAINNTTLRTTIPFRSIYIPTDVQWKRQLDILDKTLDANTVQMVSRCAVLITILESLCKAFSAILEYELENSRLSELEINLSKKLIDNWNLKKPITPTLKSIEIYFLTLNANLNAKLNKAIIFGGDIEFDDLFFSDFFSLVRIGCETFQVVTNITPKKWALCFDELEIAPNWLQLELLDLLRSSSQEYIFKLTTAPIISLYKQVQEKLPVSNATEGNDYNVIRVWTSDQKSLKDWRAFCDKIVQSKIRNRVQEKFQRNPKNIFGDSFLEYSIKDAFPGSNLDYDTDDYKENTPTWFAIKELAKKDHTFEVFLRKKGIDPLNPIPRSKTQVDEVFRKIKQIVIYRLHLKRNSANLRSRKVTPLYYGLPIVYEICDGNPRVLIGLINDFLNLAIKEDGSLRELSINEQSRILTTLSERYLLILSSHPDSTIELNDKNYNIVDLIERISDFFFQKTIIESFKMDQFGSFRVDSDLPNKLIKLIEFGLHIGAFVYLDNNKAIDGDGVVGKNFRLTYTLYPYFNLIPRNNKEEDLSTILGAKKNFQPTLFKSL